MADVHSGNADSSAIYALALAFLVGSAMLSGALWFSVGGVANSINSVDQTLLAKQFVINTQGAAANNGAANNGAQQGTGQQAQPSAPTQPTAPTPSNTVDVSGRAIKGSATAQVTIVEFSEFQCPYCIAVQPTIAQVLTDYSGKVNLVHMNFIIHPTAHLASVAVECAGDQGKYFDMFDKVFASQGAKTDDAGLKEIAGQIGLDMAKFNACIAGTGKDATLSAQQNAGSAVGVGGTPSFIIGKMSNGKVTGQLIVGAQPYANFKAAVDAALAG